MTETAKSRKNSEPTAESFEILQRRSGKVLHRLKTSSLQQVQLAHLDLRGADLARLTISESDFSGSELDDSDLQESSVRSCKVSGTKLIGALLSRATFSDCNLFKAVLKWADLRSSYHTGVSFREADLRCADLRGGVFCEVDFEQARLDEACLRGATFIACNFRGANFTKASIGGTVFSNCFKLHEARGLHGTGHLGPTSLDFQTLRASIGALPDDFLIEVGLTRDEIDGLRATFKKSGQSETGSCFLVYAAQDQKFADFLCTALRALDIPTWLCRSQAAPGAATWPWDVTDMLHKHDKIILICSQHSLSSRTVAKVASAAIEEERTTRIQKLYPVRVDAFVLTDEIRKIAEKKLQPGDQSLNWMHYVRAYMSGDFTSWTNPAAFKAEVDRLSRILSTPAKR